MALYNPNAKPAAIPITPTPKEEIAQTVLSFGNPIVATSSSVSTLNYSLPINITTGKNKVTAVQLELQYDPKVLRNVAVIPDVFFSNPEVLLNQIDIKTGRITYALGSSLQDQAVMGEGVVATLNFEAEIGTPKETLILFLPKTLVTAEGVNQPVLKQTNNIQLIVGERISTPSAQ